MGTITNIEVVGLGFHTTDLSRAIFFASKKAKELKQSVTIAVNGTASLTVNRKGVLKHA